MDQNISLRYSHRVAYNAAPFNYHMHLTPFLLEERIFRTENKSPLIIHSVPYTEPLVNKDFRKAAKISLCINVIPETSQKAVHIA